MRFLIYITGFVFVLLFFPGKSHAQPLQKCYNISGTVVDYETHPYVKLGNVKIKIENKEYTTSPDGAFKFSVPSEGKYSLRFTCPQYDTLVKNIYVSTDTTLEIALRPQYCDYFPMKTGKKIFKYFYKGSGSGDKIERNGRLIWDMYELVRRNDTLVLKVNETRIDTTVETSKGISKSHVDTVRTAFEIYEDKLHFLTFSEHLKWERMSRYYKFTAPKDKEIETDAFSSRFFKLNVGLVRIKGQLIRREYDGPYYFNLIWEYELEE